MIRVDMSEYTRVPNISARATLRLAKALIKGKPQITNDTIEKATETLMACIHKTDAGLTARLRETSPELIASESSFDRAVDGLWVCTRRALEAYEAYAYEGLDALPPDLATKAQLAEARQLATRARKLHERLFGAEGTTFVLRPFVEQAESMAAILRLIEEDGLGEELEALVGPSLPRLLSVCQTHYEAMVSDRLHRKRGMGDNLRELRDELRWYIAAYNNAILTLIDQKEPETVNIVTDALRPIVTMRRRLRRSTEQSEDEALLGYEDEIDETPELPELPELPESPALLEAAEG